MEAGTQFIGIKPEINMAERKSNVANNPTDVFTIEDIASVSRPYKVYTALLTQDGSDDPIAIYTGDLNIGVTYSITANDGSGDFTNVGAPNNEQGTSFVATGATPNSWGNFEMVALEYNNGAPVANVLENTIGNIWFIYGAIGEYRIGSDELFTDSKTLVFNKYLIDFDSASISDYVATTRIDIKTFSISSGEYSNNYLLNSPIEIRVYPSDPAV